MKDTGKTHDISRLCEALGLDPSMYVSFAKQARAAVNPDKVSVPRDSTANGSTAAAGPFLAHSAPTDASMDRHAVRSGAHVGPLTEVATRPMQIAMLSLSGGSGKTTLAATLANALHARKQSVMLADHSPYNALQTLLQLHGDRMTAVSFAIGTRVSTPLPVLSRYHQGEKVADFDAWYESLAARTSFTFVDGITDAVAQGKELISRGARVLIPVVPEVVGAMSAVTLDKALNTPWPGRVTYVLNRFDANEGLHRDVRVWLRENLGARLLPFEIPNDQELKHVATGALLVKDLAQYSPMRFALESLVELLEKCGAQEETVRAEVRQ
jgi:hypothetical protein